MNREWIAGGYTFGELRDRVGDVRVICAPEAQESARDGRSVWDRILGLTTMLVVSVGGWAAIIALARRLL